MATSARLYLLDEPHALWEGCLYPLPPSRPGQLLLFLAYRGEWVARETLAGLLWPEIPEEEARHNLRVALHRARSLPWAQAVEVNREQVRFPMATDVAEFRAALGRGDWEEAVRIHRRPFLMDFPLREAPALEDWASLERQSLLEAWQYAAKRRAQELEEAGEAEEASRLLLEVLRHDLLAEDVLQAYLRAAQMAGQREAALKVYDRFRRELGEGLGLEPARVTQELAQALRQTQPLAAPASPRPTFPLGLLHPPRMVGREEELAALRRARFALVSGEAGVGKTRLLLESFPEALRLRCLEGLENLPWHPILVHLRRHLDKLPDLGPYREDLARLLPEAFPGLAPPPPEPGSSKPRLLEALARALAPAERLLFDDLQWADENTLELLLYLLERGQPWIGAYRPQEVGPVLERTLEALRAHGVETVALKPLEAGAVHALLADLTGAEEGPPLFSRWLRGKTGGNPFFALEVLKALFEGGVLREEGGRWRTPLDEVTRDYTELQVPPKVAGVVARRLGRLSPEALRTLQAASILGEGFPPQVLAPMAGLSEWAVMEGLEEAEQAGIVAGNGFVHDLFRQSIYQGLSQARRQFLHARAAQSLQGQAPPQVVAEHWFQAGAHGEAAHNWLVAARAYLKSSLPEEAARVLERAYPHAQGLEGPEMAAHLARSYRELGQYAQAQRWIQEALRHPSPRWQADALVEQTWVLLGQGRLEEAAKVLQEAQAIQARLEPEPLEEGSLELALAKLGSNLAFRQGQFAASCQTLEPLAARLRTQGPSLALAGILVSLGSSYDHLGQETQAIATLEEALQVAHRVGARYYLVDGANNLLGCLIRQGRCEEGLAQAKAALALGEYEGTAFLRNNLAVAYLSLGQEKEALALFEANAHGAPDAMLRVLAWARLAELYPRHGLAGAVEHALDQALETALGMDLQAVPVRFLLALLRWGTGAQLRRAAPLLQEGVAETLPPPWREAYLEALAQRGLPPSSP